MKELTNKELQAKADRVFAEFPKAEKVYATTDGNVFLEENRANLHAKKGKVIPFDRPLSPEPLKEDNKDVKYTAVQAIELIKEADLVGLAQFANDTRKTVVEAYQARLEELGVSNQDNPKEDEEE